MKMKKGGVVNKKMSAIIRVLHQEGKAMTANEITKKIRERNDISISYPTSQKYLNQLEGWRIIFDPMKTGKGAIAITVTKTKRNKTNLPKKYKLNYNLIFGKKLPDWLR